MVDAKPRLYGVGVKALRLQLDVPPFTEGLTNQTPAYLALNAEGAFPLLVSGNGAAHASAAPALKELLGSSAAAAKWAEWSAATDGFMSGWIDGLLGVAEANEAAAASAASGFRVHLAALESALCSSRFATLGGGAAVDAAVAMSLFAFYLTVFDEKLRAEVPKTAAFLATAVLTQPWSGARTRAAFNEFFETKAHTYWASSSVVPHNDPTLLFTNAGMNQASDQSQGQANWQHHHAYLPHSWFKPVFLGTVDPNSDMGKLKRACNSQKCIRAGGKHNDLDDVGKDVYHHTFFEMLGNWSFGDYFKEEAISWAWELLTKWYKLPADRLYATYFRGDPGQGLPADDEAREIWLRFLPESRVLPYGNKENFWEMGDQGPCGPCTEIHFDRIGGRDAADLVNADDPNVLEIWNNVFIQFNREPDGTLKTLPAKHVDTGMGLERITSVLQGKMSNYATDLFGPIFDAIQQVTGARTYTDKIGKEDADGVDMAYRVVADHIRTLSFSIADGARPGNEGRDYVLRRILRRAVRYGRETLGAKEGFFAGLVDVVVANFGGFFPELVKQRDTIYSVLREEEAAFSRTLVKGIERFKKAASAATDNKIPGYEAFVLWDTYGFPVDLTQLMAEERGMTVDMPAYEAALNEAREKSRQGGKKAAGAGIKFEAEATGWLQSNGVPLTNDAPKYGSSDVSAKVLAILTPGGFVASTSEAADQDGPVGLVLDTTSFYAESGGQIGDTGAIRGPEGAALVVSDCQVAAGFVLHVGEASVAPFRVGDEVTVSVDYERRSLIKPNHTFTHVLNFALKSTLGDHVDQKGSIVLPDKLRFDFSNAGPVEANQLAAVEKICREAVAAAMPVHSGEVPLAQARSINGLRAVFGEVYPDPVRVVSIGRAVEELLADPKDAANAAFSIEFCGGTHLSNTSEAEAFALLSEEGIAKGIRRIVAVTRGDAVRAIEAAADLKAELASIATLPEDQLEKACKGFKESVDAAVIPAVDKAALRDELAVLGRRVIEFQKAAAAANKALAAERAVAAADAAVAAGKSFVIGRLDVGLDTRAVGEACSAIIAKHSTLAALFVSVDAEKGKALAYAAVPDSVTDRLKANEWVSTALGPLGGKGGGKANNAQGQGANVEKVDEALGAATAFAESKLQ
ncbi:hypothetical protein VOLCADRAFT_120886 [Volvox carteri f. nagariensis]|uniref:Alanine--tRNA ligase n=1 Tax=Volvox carteri f. nagariensis TaxID=3068 RepID=D8TVU1_VOLCA|nr:uncharacterized protein VOLCADRAFT_120886 [Volvox carteri f. nagariensis]EFJ48362.1 hypothetical protein VOLCADRAFT_120886 [Volvox carteri f. nagariensis]|eukprot:XP_002950616.1 hypothetical protein VOLCADRAFT_120886 [Volvox carteri f. nagariensis]